MAKKIQLDSKLTKALEKFFDLKCEYDKRYHNYDGIRRVSYSYSCGSQFVVLHAYDDRFFMDTNGNFYRKRKGSSFGNIFDCLDKGRWGRQVRYSIIRVSTSGPYPSASPTAKILVIESRNECEICSSRDRVKRTVVGFRCRHHRGADTRHINAVRDLGGIPRTDAGPITNYLFE